VGSRRKPPQTVVVEWLSKKREKEALQVYNRKEKNLPQETVRWRVFSQGGGALLSFSRDGELMMMITEAQTHTTQAQ
jgi:hypothetical protein